MSSAYLFDMTTGQQLFKLRASDAAECDEFGDEVFGYSVAISGNRAIVGTDFSDSAYIFTLPFPQPVDFNEDGLCNEEDVDMLRDAISSASSDRKYEVNGDSVLDEEDFADTIHINVATEFGDSNLDWNVDAQDLANVRLNFGATAGWVSLNSNLDDTVDAADLALVRTNFGYSNPFVSAAPLAVPTPEPGGVLLMVGGVLALGCRRDFLSRYC